MIWVNYTIGVGSAYLKFSAHFSIGSIIMEEYLHAHQTHLLVGLDQQLAQPSPVRRSLPYIIVLYVQGTTQLMA